MFGVTAIYGEKKKGKKDDIKSMNKQKIQKQKNIQDHILIKHCKFSSACSSSLCMCKLIVGTCNKYMAAAIYFKCI